MQTITLTKPALIAGQYHAAGSDVSVPDIAVIEQGYQIAEREKLRQKITKTAGDTQSLLGTAADASAYAIDDVAMDILAVAGSANSSYKDKRIELYNELHGVDAWDKAVSATQSWFDGRKSGAIKLPIDIKGVETMMADVAAKGTGITQVLEQAIA